jgi:glycosyltransferase involved in cell wall biosynthesis
LKERSPDPLVSVIVPTYNSQKTIQQCLQSIELQNYRNTETIVVDRHSTDETVQTASWLNAKILLTTRERSTAKNIGAQRASGDFLLFLDSDMELDPGTLEECVELCIKRGFDAVTIPLKAQATGFLATCRKIDRGLYDNDPNLFQMPRFFGKRAFLSVHGFDEELVCGEDFDLARRYEKQGYRIGVAVSPIKHLEGQLSLRKIVMKDYYYGKSLIPFFSKEPKLALRGYCPTRFVWNIRRLLRQPTYLMGLSAVKLFEYAAYLAGILAYALGGARL